MLDDPSFDNNQSDIVQPNTSQRLADQKLVLPQMSQSEFAREVLTSTLETVGLHNLFQVQTKAYKNPPHNLAAVNLMTGELDPLEHALWLAMRDFYNTTRRPALDIAIDVRAIHEHENCCAFIARGKQQFDPGPKFNYEYFYILPSNAGCLIPKNSSKLELTSSVLENYGDHEVGTFVIILPNDTKPALIPFWTQEGFSQAIAHLKDIEEELKRENAKSDKPKLIGTLNIASALLVALFNCTAATLEQENSAIHLLGIRGIKVIEVKAQPAVCQLMSSAIEVKDLPDDKETILISNQTTNVVTTMKVRHDRIGLVSCNVDQATIVPEELVTWY